MVPKAGFEPARVSPPPPQKTPGDPQPVIPAGKFLAKAATGL